MSAEAVTRALGGKWHGRYGVAFCPAHDNRRTPALSLSDGADGRLLAHCFAGCPAPAVLGRLRDLGCETGAPRECPEAWRRPDVASRAARSDAERTARALRLWSEARDPLGTPGACYLRCRGYRGPIPGAVRFHPSLRHPS
ncbi:MAG: hypothetical protein RIM80_00085, partial [Alphaproteobacteria bacterium]